jgi:hypothetical protein
MPIKLKRKRKGEKKIGRKRHGRNRAKGCKIMHIAENKDP